MEERRINLKKFIKAYTDQIIKEKEKEKDELLKEKDELLEQLKEKDEVIARLKKENEELKKGSSDNI
jgi:hypothetical protein